MHNDYAGYRERYGQEKGGIFYEKDEEDFVGCDSCDSGNKPFRGRLRHSGGGTGRTDRYIC